jgi:hypothetical protein
VCVCACVRVCVGEGAPITTTDTTITTTTTHSCIREPTDRPTTHLNGHPPTQLTTHPPTPTVRLLHSYKGAFGATPSDMWLAGLSWLDDNDKLVAAPETTIIGNTVNLCGTMTGLVHLTNDFNYVLTCQVYIKNQLIIDAGVTIKAARTAAVYSASSPAPALIIERGATIIAQGTKDMPITFTTAETIDWTDPDTASKQGLWGGIIILGNAIVQGGELEVEGITGYYYGGNNNADNSGILQYVRVWHGGSVIGANNEINGITFAGVGSGTTVDHIEVAFNADDGIECFGGTVDMK